MMWARIENSVVIEITDIDPTDRFHPDFQWVPCSEETAQNWLFIQGVFSLPPSADTGQSLSHACTPAQGLVALFALKQITEEHVLETIAQIPDPVQQYTARIGYQRATVWERGSPTMQSMAQLLQLSEKDLDALFAHAVTVQV